MPQSPDRSRGGPLYASCVSGPAGPTVQRRWRLAPEHVVDLFVYVVVLNLANEYVPTVITETFTVSLLTAVLLKVVLEGVVWVKDRLKGRFKAATTTVGKIGAGVALWLVLVVSKFVVLTLEDLFFGDAVELGGFVPVTLLILVLMVSRAGVRRLLTPPSASRPSKRASPPP